MRQGWPATLQLSVFDVLAPSEPKNQSHSKVTPP